MFLYVHRDRRDRVRNGEPRKATSTFIRHPSSDMSSSMLLYVHRDIMALRDGGAQDDHLDFHTAHEL